MSDLIRQVSGLKIEIDATLCVAFGDCIEIAPEAFQLDAEDVVEFVMPEDVERERLLKACKECPVDALSVWDDGGRQLVP